MNASYELRLLLLCGEVFFLVHLSLGLLLHLLTPRALLLAERMKARQGASFLFVMRMLPFLASLFVVLCLCLPCYLLLEPDHAVEQVGYVCVGLTITLALQFLGALQRGLSAVYRSWRYRTACQHAAITRMIEGEPTAVWEIPAPSPFLAVAGITRPQLIASDKLLALLSLDELKVALQHERAHTASCDNLKRLVLLTLPRLLLGINGFSRLEHAWSCISERSADEAAIEGDPQRGLLLASALVRIAKWKRPAQPGLLLSCIITDGLEFSARVNFLLGRNIESKRVGPTTGWVLALIVICPITLGLLLVTHPNTLLNAFELLEKSLR